MPPTEPLTLTYLGGIPKRDRPEAAQVTVFDTHIEIGTPHWGWSIGLDAIRQVGEPQPTGDGGLLFEVRWEPPGEPERSLSFGGKDAGRLRFFLAQNVARARVAEELAAEDPMDVRRSPGAPRPLTPWQRELRRMRALSAAGMTVALAALLVVFGVAVFVVGGQERGHWPADRATVRERQAELRAAEQRGEPTALSAALQALQDACNQLTSYNGAAGNDSGAFNEVQQICATVGVTLF